MDTVQGSMDVELPARISARGVIAGILGGLALAAVMMALGTAVGVTAFPLDGTARLAGVALAAWSLLSFAVGGFAGGWLAAACARALHRRDGVLHGLITWAALALVSMSLVGGVMRGAAVGILGESSLGGEAGDQAPALSRHKGAELRAWGTFAGLLVPLFAAVAGGALAASRERRIAGLVDERAARRRRPIVTSPRHTGDAPLRPPLPQT
jgi:hypothetical protein